MFIPPPPYKETPRLNKCKKKNASHRRFTIEEILAEQKEMVAEKEKRENMKDKKVEKKK